MKLVLAIDGGGIRGILPGRLLEALQDAGKFPRFDLVSGTSTGGIIACGIASGIPVKNIVDLYVNKGGQVFNGNFAGGIVSPKYDPGNLEGMLQAVLGTRMLSHAAPELLVPSYCIQFPSPVDTDGDGIAEGAGSWFFKSWEARAGIQPDLLLWRVARCTSAAPTYFPAAPFDGRWMVDGGVFANNPADCAWAAATRLWPGETIKVLSIGTGAKVQAIDGARSQGWGAAQWAPEISSVFMDGGADKTSYITRTILGASFMRCETALSGVNDAFDDASPKNIADLNTLAVKFVSDNLANVEKFLTV